MTSQSGRSGRRTGSFLVGTSSSVCCRTRQVYGYPGSSGVSPELGASPAHRKLAYWNSDSIQNELCFMN